MERRITIDTRHQTGLIRPEIHGHFLEHLGSATYGGIWVGKDSPIPNIDGLRRDAVEYLRTLGVPVLRWPGGCFADAYNWRNGVGPPSARPVTVNHSWGGACEDNSFGTHEFMRLCALIGAQPYLAANLGSGSPAELRDWVEYCNFPSGSTLAAKRTAHGHPEPFNVRYWGIGNESWACGGHLTPEEYCGLYARFATFIPACGDSQPHLIAVGPNGNDTAWTRRFFEAFRNGRSYHPPLHGYAMHFYAWGTRTATRYDTASIRQQFLSFDAMEHAIIEQRAYLDHYQRLLDIQPIDLIVDEWGTWDKSDLHEEEQHGMFWQQNTMKDGVAAALALNVFHRHADKLAMCNLAQLINVLQAPLLTDGDKCCRTPTYYAFQMLQPHRGGTAVHVHSPYVPSQEISISASIADDRLSITIVNPDPDTDCTVRCAIQGDRLTGTRASILAHLDMNAHNAPGAPDIITPQAHAVRLDGDTVTLALPAHAIVHVTVQLHPLPKIPNV
jgi:alpha-N-arabinofuranosidase